MVRFMPKPTDQEIEDRFAHHPPQNGAIDLHSEVRRRAAEFALWLNTNLPESRELSDALTDLQSAAQWANAAIAIHISGAGPQEPCPNCGEMVSRVGLKPGENAHYTYQRGLIGSGRWTCVRKPSVDDARWDSRLRVQRAQHLLAEDPGAHVLVLTETGWTILHSAECARAGDTPNCVFTKVAEKTDFAIWPSPVKLGIRDNGGGAYLVNAGV